MAKSHKIEYDVGSNPEGTSSQQVSDVYYDDSGTPVPQIQTTDLGKVLTAGTNDPVWAEGEGGGTWGDITGDIEKQTDLITILDEHGDDILAIQQAYVTKDTAQTLTGAKTWTDSNNSTIINAVRMDNVLTSGSNKYEARTQPNGYRSAYIDSSQNWTGFRLMSPENPGSNPRSTLYHYVTRNGTQQTYTLQLPEASGVLCVDQAPTAREWTEIAHITDPTVYKANITAEQVAGMKELLVYGTVSGGTNTFYIGDTPFTGNETEEDAISMTLFAKATGSSGGYTLLYAATFGEWTMGIKGINGTASAYNAGYMQYSSNSPTGNAVRVKVEDIRKVGFGSEPTAIDLYVYVR